MATSDFSSVSPQYPLNAAGSFGPNAILSYGRFYTASGGLVGLGQVSPSGVATGIKNAGPAGWPGMGATLVGTGRYNVIHPPATVLALAPLVSAPSGQGMYANTFHGVATGFSGDQSGPGALAATGITQIQVFQPPNASGLSAAMVNPPTGTRFDLLLYVAPTNTGFAQF